jgi:hypothetical protein
VSYEGGILAAGGRAERDGAAEFFGAFYPFLNDDFHVGESFLVPLSVGGAAGKCRTSGAPRLVYHAPSAYALG